MNDGTMTVNTTKGKIKVIPSYDNEYPGVSVYCEGELIAMVEYSSEQNNFRTISYKKDMDEPIAITNF